MIERGGRAGKEGVRRPCASGVEDQRVQLGICNHVNRITFNSETYVINLKERNGQTDAA